MTPPDAAAKEAHELNSKQDIVLLDAEDIGEAIAYDPHANLDVSVIIQEGFKEQREAEELADAATDDADVQLISPIPSPLPSLSAPASPPPASPPPASPPPKPPPSPLPAASLSQGAGMYYRHWYHQVPMKVASKRCYHCHQKAQYMNQSSSGIDY